MLELAVHTLALAPSYLRRRKRFPRLCVSLHTSASLRLGVKADFL